MNSLIEKVYAAGGVTVPTITPATNGASDIGTLFTQISSWIIWIAGAAAFIYLVYSGILYISAAGNPDQAKKGQQGIINAVIGIVIVVLALTIVSVISNTAKSTL